MKEVFYYPDVTGGADGPGVVEPEPFDREKRIRDYEFDTFAADIEDTAMFVRGIHGVNQEEIDTLVADMNAKVEAIKVGLAVDPHDRSVLDNAEMVAFYCGAYMVEAGSLDSMVAALGDAPRGLYQALQGSGLIRPEAVEQLDALLNPPAEHATQE